MKQYCHSERSNIVILSEAKNLIKIYMEKREVIYNGESVKIYGTDVPEEILVCFTDSITAFNKIKKASIADKGMLNAGIAAMIFRKN